MRSAEWRDGGGGGGWITSADTDDVRSVNWRDTSKWHNNGRYGKSSMEWTHFCFVAYITQLHIVRLSDLYDTSWPKSAVWLCMNRAGSISLIQWWTEIIWLLLLLWHVGRFRCSEVSAFDRAENVPQAAGSRGQNKPHRNGPHWYWWGEALQA